VQLEFDFLTYDPIFEKVDLSVWETMQAVWKLARSGATNALGRRRGVLGDVADRVRWTAGYVVAWVEDDEFQRKTRALVLDKVAQYQPDMVLAHSLGTLVTYNAFAHRDAARADVAAAIARTRYVTLGSQLGNPFVIGNLAGGRLEPLPVKFWHHLYNEGDDVFTAPIKLWDARNFQTGRHAVRHRRLRGPLRGRVPEAPQHHRRRAAARVEQRINARVRRRARRA
jgi:hypothetical protein